MPGEAAATGEGTGTGEGAGEGTALEGAGEGAGEGTALEGAGTGEPTVYEFPDKFKGEDGEGDVQGLLKSYGELEKVLGGLGKPPETADDYKIELEGKFPEGVKVDEESNKAFLGRCHEKGMTNDMVQFVMDEYAGIVTNSVNEGAETREGTIEQLKELFGKDYGDKMLAARNAFTAAGVEGLDINDVGNNPSMIQILAVLGENLTEDQLPANMQTGAGGMSEEELQSLMKSKAYWDPKEAEHAAVKAKVEAHYKAKFAKKGKK